MKSQRYNFDDLMVQLRENNIDRVSDVSFAILEPSGKLTVVKKENSGEHRRLEMPLIIDGSIQTENLSRIGKDKQWCMKSYENTDIQTLQTFLLLVY